jgi:hypothetical protein
MAVRVDSVRSASGRRMSLNGSFELAFVSVPRSFLP